MINFSDRDKSHEYRSWDDEMLNVLLSYEKDIKKDLASLKDNKYFLGLHLISLWNSCSFRCHVDKYSSENCTSPVFFSYLSDKFGLDKSQASRYMNVVSEFGDDARGFKPEYADYSYSLLIEMLSLTPEQRKFVKSDWTVKHIREYKKELSGVVAMSQQDPKDEAKFLKVYIDSNGSVISERSRRLLSEFNSNNKDLKTGIVDYCQKLFVGFDYEGYNFSDKERLDGLCGLLSFAVDVGHTVFSDSSINFCCLYHSLKKLGYISSHDDNA